MRFHLKNHWQIAKFVMSLPWSNGTEAVVISDGVPKRLFYKGRL